MAETSEQNILPPLLSDEQYLYRTKVSANSFRCMKCHLQLTTPTYQCLCGYLICLSCKELLRNKCVNCEREMIPCYVIDDIIKTMKYACKNDAYDCNTDWCLADKEKHEKECAYSPYLCPEDDCCLLFTNDNLIAHVSYNHNLSVTTMSYNVPTAITISPGVPQYLQLDQEDKTLLRLDCTPLSAQRNETVVSVGCIRPENLAGPNIRCGITAFCKKSVQFSTDQTVDVEDVSTLMWNEFPSCFPRNDLHIPGRYICPNHENNIFSVDVYVYVVTRTQF